MSEIIILGISIQHMYIHLHVYSFMLQNKWWFCTHPGKKKADSKTLVFHNSPPTTEGKEKKIQWILHGKTGNGCKGLPYNNSKQTIKKPVILRLSEWYYSSTMTSHKLFLICWWAPSNYSDKIFVLFWWSFISLPWFPTRSGCQLFTPSACSIHTGIT